MHTAIPLTLLATALACSLGTAPAHARARVFVASYGNDANPCTFGSPCKTFQQAVNVVDAGGEVTAIDSAGFGPIFINKSVTITSPAGVEAGIVPPAGGDAIDINAGSTDVVLLRGLTMDGAGAGIGASGIVFSSGGILTVTDCVVQNFSSYGIRMRPTSGIISFVITNTVLAHNDFGIDYEPLGGSPNAVGVIDHVTASNSSFGMMISTAGGGGSTSVAISNSIASNNTSVGISVANGSAPLKVSIDNTGLSGNAFGIFAGNTSNVILGRSVITANGTGINNSTSGFSSYQDNRINGNATDTTSPLNSVALR